MAHTLTECARAGYSRAANPHLPTSPCWYAHELGAFLLSTGRCTPVAVRMGRGDSIRANDMRFTFKHSAGALAFDRVE